MIELDKLLDQDLEHIGKALEQSERSNAVRAETALERSTNLAFKIDVKQGQQGIYQQEAYTYKHTFGGDCEPFGHKRAEQVVNPRGYDCQIVHSYDGITILLFVLWLLYTRCLTVNIGHNIVKRTCYGDKVGNLATACQVVN